MTALATARSTFAARHVRLLAVTVVIALGLSAGALPANATVASAPSATTVSMAAKVAKFTRAPIPVISGTREVGKVLTAKTGVWAPNPVSFSYQWKRAGVAIAGATRSSYVVRPGDVGKAIAVTVTAKRTKYISTTRQSASTGKVLGLAYKNCTALTVAYPHGVAKDGVKFNLANGKPRAFKGPTFHSTALYTLNKKSDRDRDGIACER